MVVSMFFSICLYYSDIAALHPYIKLPQWVPNSYFCWESMSRVKEPHSDFPEYPMPCFLLAQGE